MVRLLIVTPYAPGLRHPHAAAAIASPLAAALSVHFEVHIAAPRLDLPDDGAPTGVERHWLSTPTASRRSALGAQAYAVRKDWPRRATGEVRHLVDRLRPAHLHLEYLQSGEAGPASGMPWSITLHDLSTPVFRATARAATSPVERGYRVAECARIARLERRVIGAARRLFVLSDRDAEALTRPATVLKLGAEVPARAWRPRRSAGPPTVVLAGAWWRPANRATYRWTVEQVMPLVWHTRPDIVLRVCGEGARDLPAPAGGRVQLVGPVESIESAYRDADIVLAPGVVPAGVLVKALTGLAVGAPVVLNAEAARPFGADVRQAALVGADAREVATHLTDLAADPRGAEELGRRGRLWVAEHYSWGATAARMAATLRSEAA